MPTKPSKGEHKPSEGSQKSGPQKATAGSSVTDEQTAEALSEARRRAAEDAGDQQQEG